MGGWARGAGGGGGARHGRGRGRGCRRRSVGPYCILPRSIPWPLKARKRLYMVRKLPSMALELRFMARRLPFMAADG
eukprot:3339422-Rhodomonas_salina.1